MPATEAAAYVNSEEIGLRRQTLLRCVAENARNGECCAALWPAARMAATTEPTIEEPISKIRALNNRPPSKSTMLSNIRRVLRAGLRTSKLASSKNRRADSRGAFGPERSEHSISSVPCCRLDREFRRGLTGQHQASEFPAAIAQTPLPSST